jgi:hypothetical protein
MTGQLGRALVTIALLVMTSGRVGLAHHSYAMFDQTKRASVQGTVYALEWTNPHVWVWVSVPDSTGKTTTFGFETNAPSELSRFFGWNKQSLTAGERVAVDYSPLKSGRPGGALRTITFPDGRTLRTPRSNDNYFAGPTEAK